MPAAQRFGYGLTVAVADGFTGSHMRAVFAVLVLLGIVLIPRAYVRSGG